MPTGICYTQSGNVKRYESAVSIELVKGSYELPSLKINDIPYTGAPDGTFLYERYTFDDPLHYTYSSKGAKDDNMPLIFVCYYPSSPSNPVYFNFDKIPKLTVFVNLLTPNSVGSNLFSKIELKYNDDIKKVDVNDYTYFEYYVNNPTDDITFYPNLYRYEFNENNYYVLNYGLSKNANLSYYNKSSLTTHICLSINNTLYFPNDNDNIIINVAKDTTAYLYVVPSYIYVAPIHSGKTAYVDNYIWGDPEKPNEVYKMACSGRSFNTGGNYDNWWTSGTDDAKRCMFNDIDTPLGCVRYSEDKGEKEKFNKWYMGVKLSTSLYEYSQYKQVTRDLYTYYRYKYVAYSNVANSLLATTNHSPKPFISYYGDATSDFQRYIEPYYSYISDNQNGNLYPTWAKAFPQNNTYIALDRNDGTHDSREPTTTMPPQYWVRKKQKYWMNFVGITNYSDVPDMILQGLICGGSGNWRNNTALGLYSAISLKGKVKNPDKLMFKAQKYSSVYFNWESRNESGRILRDQPGNSYIITGRLKSGGSSSTEAAIWEKYRFDVWSNVSKWVDEYGVSL